MREKERGEGGWTTTIKRKGDREVTEVHWKRFNVTERVGRGASKALSEASLGPSGAAGGRSATSLHKTSTGERTRFTEPPNGSERALRGIAVGRHESQ
jgi:hypothetical protein